LRDGLPLRQKEASLPAQGSNLPWQTCELVRLGCSALKEALLGEETRLVFCRTDKNDIHNGISGKQYWA